jgi:hypothetical protein
MNYYIETYQNGTQLLGSDFTKIVRNCKSNLKLQNAINKHISSLNSLMKIKPYLKNGYTLKTIKF